MPWHIATVHEDVLSTAVTVEVAKDLELAFLREVMAQLLRGVNGWVQDFARSLPTAVKIAACKRATVIAVDNTVRIEHGHDLEDEILAQVLGLDRARVNEEV